MGTVRTLVAIALAIVALQGCQRQSEGFALPPGDAARGKETFVALSCNACHHIRGEVARLEEGGHSSIDVRLGGQVSRIKTYGDLVTSIINPSHKLSRGNTRSTVSQLGESRMRNYNEVMTVQQLVDLTTYLQDTYNVYTPTFVVPQ